MEFLRQLIFYLTFASLGFTITEIYLRANKLWKRKHDKAVAESISITAMLVSIVPSSLFTLNYLFAGQWQGFIQEALYLLIVTFSILVGIELWVPGERHKSFFTLLKRSLNLERKEVADLAIALFKPPQHKTIIDILCQIALIDERLDERERKFIDTFAQKWNIEFSWNMLQLRSDDSEINFIRLRQDVENYLTIYPPTEQIIQLQDLINILIRIDKDISEAERLINIELNGMFRRYLNHDEVSEVFYTIVIPQNDKQEQASAQKFSELSRYNVAEGFIYRSQPFYSREFAKIFSNQYRALNLFSIVTEML
ncbi:tellurite resistance TerB family protein [Nostoc sp. 'Lobaria pulmonaria (5183) cyanobiont']|uniref:tellurite resistance TerB family protein n=1 Tax=Nostoc sp. 'Lobaria pulmonaria (5183) cyanobiont' TaxID=1618022 RepID=UPI000CF33878|nr:TerB family tellurite resistance protein [Nostoc sp. 'Lobaria pulmonaria (5183) cyanobiont']AVH71281.1 tellurium resistance terB-like protein [Nostoc sp. 'Lobaria pulmonaria (5183) cyanobiont']